VGDLWSLKYDHDDEVVEEFSWISLAYTPYSPGIM